MANIATLTEDEFNFRIRLRNEINEFCCDCIHWWAMDTTFGQCRCLSPVLVDKKHGAIWPETAPNFGCSDFEDLTSRFELVEVEDE